MVIKMLTVDEVRKDIDKVRFGETKQRIVGYIEAEENQNKVFTGNDISGAFPSFSRYTIIGYLRGLMKDGIIGRIKFGKEIYYGGKKTIDGIEKFRKDRNTKKVEEYYGDDLNERKV